MQHVVLADVEIHIDRVELHDRGEHGRRVAADELADRHLPRGDDAVERRRDLGVAEIDLCLLVVDLRLIEGRPARRRVCQRLIVLAWVETLLLEQLCLSLLLGLRLLQRRLGAGLGGLGGSTLCR